MIISKTFRFEASHVLPLHPGKCSRLHGHSWVLTIAVEGEVSANTGFVCDYADLGRVVEENVINKLDHTHLGQGMAISNKKAFCPYLGPDFYPSSENLSIAIGRILQPLIQEIPTYAETTVRLYEVTIEETCTSKCTWHPTGNGAE